MSQFISFYKYIKQLYDTSSIEVDKEDEDQSDDEDDTDNDEEDDTDDEED